MRHDLARSTRSAPAHLRRPARHRRWDEPRHPVRRRETRPTGPELQVSGIVATQTSEEQTLFHKGAIEPLAEYVAIAAGSPTSSPNRERSRAEQRRKKKRLETLSDGTAVDNHEGQWSVGLALADDEPTALRARTRERDWCSHNELTAPGGQSPDGTGTRSVREPWQELSRAFGQNMPKCNRERVRE